MSHISVVAFQLIYFLNLIIKKIEKKSNLVITHIQK